MAAYFILAPLLLLCAYVVFRRIVRKDYEVRGRLSPFSSLLQLLVLMAFFFFPYLYNQPGWELFWRSGASTRPALHVVGLVLIGLGFLVAFGTMFWFGIAKAFGVRVDGIRADGPYKISRNPQVLGGYLLVLGVFAQRPSYYALGWLLLYALIMHWMILTEEEHLLRVFGAEYAAYCAETPRYLFKV